MKLESQKQDVVVSGNFKKSDFKVGDVSFIVDMFADKIYTNKELAVIRELSCNAFDSHTISGNTDKPFDVHLPTSLEPFFSVRDYGTGLSDDEVRNVFAGVGISTKRDSNSLIGCFGVGSLSPYAVSDTFVVKSWHNGVVRTYSCYRDELRNPIVALLTELPTDEENGLEVSVNVRCDYYTTQDWEKQAISFFCWWDTLPNFSNDEIVESINAKKQNLRDMKFNGEDYSLSIGYRDLYVVMGNIAYKVSSELEHRIYDYSRLPVMNMCGFIKMNIGDVNFDTSRENVSIDQKTIEAIGLKLSRILNTDIPNETISALEKENCRIKRQIMIKSFFNMYERMPLTPRAEEIRSFGFTKEEKDLKIEGFRLVKVSQSRVRQFDIETVGRLIDFNMGNQPIMISEEPKTKTLLRNYVRHTDEVVIVLSKKTIDQLQLHDTGFISAKSLPKVEVQKASRKSYPKGFGIWKCNCSQTYGMSNPSKFNPDDFVKSSGQFFIRTNNLFPVDFRGMTEVNNIIRLLRAVGQEVNEIYMVNSACESSKTFKDMGINCLLTTAKDKAAEISSICILEDEDREKINRLERISGILGDDMRELITELSGYKPLSDRKYLKGIEHETSDEESKPKLLKLRQFFEKYPLLNVIYIYDLNEYQDAIEDYISK